MRGDSGRGDAHNSRALKFEKLLLGGAFVTHSDM